MDYEKIATVVRENIGGMQNVKNMTHCSTRLRINVTDINKVNLDEIKVTDGVIDAVYKNGQVQVIIGPAVGEVYQYFDQDATVSAEGDSSVEVAEQPHQSIGGRIIEFIAGTFTPILPAIIGAGLLKGFIAIFAAVGLLSTHTMTYTLLAMIADTCFYFLPVLLAFSAAKKLGANPYISVVLAGVLVHPTLLKLVASGTAINFAGIPIKAVNYSTSVIPILLIVWVQSYIEKYLNKHLPKTLGMFITPTISIVINSLLGLTILGPLGSYVGVYLGMLIAFLNNTIPWLAPTLMGAFSPLIVMLGMHYSLFPIALQSISSFGYDSFFTPAGLVSNLAQAGAGFAVALRSKERVERGTAISTSFTAVLGITEPVLYGVNLKLKRPLYAAMVGGAVGGLYCGLTHVVATALASPGVLALALFARTGQNLLNAIIGMLLAFVISFAVTLLIWHPRDTTADFKLKAVTTGQELPLNTVNDETFASGAMGQGVAFKSMDGRIVSPVDGEVVMVFPTKHAYGLRSNGGIEILIHIGIDTVQLDGKYFESHVKQGDQVKQGQVLGTFEPEKIKQAGYDDTTMLLVTNSSDYEKVNVTPMTGVEISPHTTIMTIDRKQDEK